VKAGDNPFNIFDVSGAGLDYKQNLRRALHLVFPAVDRPGAGQDVDAGGKTRFDQGMGNTFGFRLIRTGGEDKAKG
jgi:hypothetical protein